MKTNIIILATAYPYTMVILTMMWLGSALLLIIDNSLSFNLVIATNLVTTLIIAAIGFKK